MYNQLYSAAAGYPTIGSGYGFAPTAARQEVVRVNGKHGAEAYNLPPDSSALLLDTTAPIVWLIQTDGAGYKTATPYTIAPYKEEKPEDQFKQTLVTLEERIKKLEEEMINSDKSNAGSAGSKYTITAKQ